VDSATQMIRCCLLVVRTLIAILEALTEQQCQPTVVLKLYFTKECIFKTHGMVY